MNDCKAGSFVQIHKIILHPYERSAQVPNDTKSVPLEMVIKGFLLHDANMDEVVEIRTITNRIECGDLVDTTPNYKHSFGDFIPEVIEMSRRLKAFMDGDDL